MAYAKRKIPEATILTGLAAALFAYGVSEYIRVAAMGGRPSLVGLSLTTIGLIVLCLHAPWKVATERSLPGLRWYDALFMLLFAVDTGLRIYEWKTGVEWVRLPEMWVSLTLSMEYIFLEKFASSRRWLCSLA